MNRTHLGYALLLSIPPGLGVTGFATHAIGEGPVAPMAIVAGVLVTVVVFALVVGGVAVGSPDPDRE